MRSSVKGLTWQSFAVILLALSLQAADSPPVQWATFIGAPRGVPAPRVAANPEGGFYVYSLDSRPLVKFGTNRSIEWQILPETGLNDLQGIHGLDVLNDGDLIGIASAASIPNPRLFDRPVPNASFSMVRLNPDGTAKSVDPITNGVAFAIKSTPTGGYAFSGFGWGPLQIGSQQIGDGSECFFLSRIETDSRWSIIGHSTRSTDQNAIMAIRADFNGDLVVAGQATSGTWTFGGTNLIGPGVFLARINPAGSLQWAQMIPGSRRFQALELSPVGLIHIVWAGATGQNNMDEYMPEGLRTWSNPIEGTVLALQSREALFVAGREGTRPAWFLKKMDVWANVIWKKGGPGRAASSVQSMATLNDGSLVFTGDVEPSGIYLDDYLVSDFSLLPESPTQAFAGILNPIENSAPQITQQPISHKAIIGETVALQADIYSASPMTLQWFKGNDPVGPENEASLHLPNFQQSDVGDYQLVANNQFGSSTSYVAAITAHTLSVNTLAGSVAGLENHTDPLLAKFDSPKHPAILSNGAVLVADSSNHLVRRIDSTGVSTFAGEGGSVFSNLSSVAFQPFSEDGPQMYIADSGNNGIRAIRLSQDLATTLNMPAPLGTATLVSPNSVATHDGLRSMVISEEGGTRVWKMEGGELTLFAGSESGFQDGPAAIARFGAIGGVAMDARANVYVADKGNHAIRKISPSGAVTTLAGTNSAGLVDAMGIEARFDQPSSLAVDSDGNVFVTELGNHTLRKISAAGNVTTLIDAGELHAPEGISIRPDGALVIADTGNHRIREVRYAPLADDQSVTVALSLANGFNIQISGAPGEYWIESTSEISPDADWQIETSLTISDQPVGEFLSEPGSTRFYRARRKF